MHREIVDLSQEIFSGMPVFMGLPDVNISVHATHEEWSGSLDNLPKPPSVLRLELSEHTGTHVDSLSHMAPQYFESTIDSMPLNMFYTEGICLNFSTKSTRELITAIELERACDREKVQIKPGDTVLLYTDHYRKAFNTKEWTNGPGITAEAARWLGSKYISAFGVETMSPGIPGISNSEVHKICGELGFTHYENMVNLHLLIGRGRFRFIALPLKIKGGTGSPVRAIAVFE